MAAAGLILTVSASVSIECMRSTYCQCMTNNYQRKEVEFQCDSPNSTTTTVRIKGSSLVHVECYRGSEPLLPPGVNLGEVENFEVFYCSLPATLKEVRQTFLPFTLSHVKIKYLPVSRRLRHNIPEFSNHLVRRPGRTTHQTLLRWLPKYNKPLHKHEKTKRN